MEADHQRTSTPEEEPSLNSNLARLTGLGLKPTPAEETDYDGPPLDAVFEVLKNSRRRHVIRYLDENDGETTLSDLSEAIAAEENDTTPSQVTSDQRKRVYVALYQCHLSKMDDAGVIHYNQDRGQVTLTDQADHFIKYLADAGESTTTRWYRLYAGVAVVGILLFTSATLLGLSGQVLTLCLGAVVGLMIGCPVFHWYSASDHVAG